MRSGVALLALASCTSDREPVKPTLDVFESVFGAAPEVAQAQPFAIDAPACTYARYLAPGDGKRPFVLVHPGADGSCELWVGVYRWSGLATSGHQYCAVPRDGSVAIEARSELEWYARAEHCVLDARELDYEVP